MSDTFRRAMTAKLPMLPPTRAPWAENSSTREEDGEEELEDGLGDLVASSVNLKNIRISAHFQREVCLA
jgi:hypothetical protein